MNHQIILCLVGLVGLAIGHSIAPLNDGVVVSGSLPEFSMDYYSLDSEGTGGMTLTVKQTSGIVYVIVGSGFVPSFSNATYTFFNMNATKSLTTSFFVGTFYIAVYGYSDASYTIVGWGDIPTAVMIPGQVISGTMDSKENDFYTITIPSNAFDFSLIVTTSGGDPDQFVYNSLSFDSPVWYNSSTVSSSCIFVQFPPSGTYYYKLYAYVGPYTYSTGFFLNYGHSCQLPSSSISFGGIELIEKPNGKYLDKELDQKN